MCLDRLEDFPTGENETGYKIFYKGMDSKLTSEYRPFRELLVNTWLHEEDYRYYSLLDTADIATDYTHEYYPHGFHIYKYKKNAEQHRSAVSPTGCVVLPVQYINIVAKGIQAGWKTIVAKDIKIIKRK